MSLVGCQGLGSSGLPWTLLCSLELSWGLLGALLGRGLSWARLSSRALSWARLSCARGSLALPWALLGSALLQHFLWKTLENLRYSKIFQKYSKKNLEYSKNSKVFAIFGAWHQGLAGRILTAGRVPPKLQKLWNCWNIQGFFGICLEYFGISKVFQCF